MPDRSRLTAAGDERLIAAALNGDASSFGAIVERYWNMAVALAMTRISNPIDAEDAAQESFIKAYSQLHTLRDPSRFAGWLSRIIAQQCANLLRKRARDKMVSSHETAALEALGSAAALYTNPGLSAEQAHFVRRTVSQLPEGFRKVVIMRFVGGLSASQIARQLGKHHGTVRVALHRAYKTLRKDLASLLEEIEQ
jgi:RNA polymerase sigma-70 factor (ECF subfamily)